MNIIITTKCNKNCTFCFAKSTQKNEQEMSYENFCHILDLIDNYHNINIGGGEPTIHSQFELFINELITRKKTFNLITNGLYSKTSVENIIINAIKKKFLQNILINISELNPKKYLKLFTKNYIKLSKLEKENPAFNLIASLTLNRNSSCDQEISYLENLLKIIPIKKLRISLDFPVGTKNDFSFINNKVYGQKILKIIALCKTYKIIINSDCILPPCIFENKNIYPLIQTYINNVYCTCSDSLIPLDILPDLKYCHCYSANYLYGHLQKHKNIDELTSSIIAKKKILNSSKKIPQECISCIQYQNKTCHSLCIGCYNKKSIDTKKT